MSDTPLITKIKDSDNPDEIGHYLVGTPVGMKSLRLPTETQAKRAAEVVKRMIEAEARIRELEGRINRADRYLALGSPNGAREALAPPDSEPAEGEGERCPVCEQGKLTRIECCVCDTCDASPVLADQIRRNDERLGVTPPQRRDAGDILREKLSDPEAMQRVTERAAERQDAMLERREAVEEMLDELKQFADVGSERTADPVGARSRIGELARTLRQALSRTSDEGAGDRYQRALINAANNVLDCLARPWELTSADLVAIRQSLQAVVHGEAPTYADDTTEQQVRELADRIEGGAEPVLEDTECIVDELRAILDAPDAGGEER